MSVLRRRNCEEDKYFISTSQGLTSSNKFYRDQSINPRSRVPGSQQKEDISVQSHTAFAVYPVAVTSLLYLACTSAVACSTSTIVGPVKYYITAV